MCAGATARSQAISSAILIVRLGAMGDVLHALPAAASLKQSFPGSELTWVVENSWAALLRGNGFIDRVVAIDRRNARSWLGSLRELREQHFSIALDLQGLMKSALTAALARPDRIVGYSRKLVRERMASWFYSNHVSSNAVHVVDRHLDAVAAAGAGNLTRAFPLPPGTPEGNLPNEPFVLATPGAGWKSKQWPLEYYAACARLLRERWRIPLVLNGPASAETELCQVPGAHVHISGIAGLIDASRRAAAVIGVDSGPMHLAAALAKPGVAIFGPTDPARNGPYGGTLTVVRSPRARVADLPRGDYERGNSIDVSMREVTPEEVVRALEPALSSLPA